MIIFVLASVTSAAKAQLPAVSEPSPLILERTEVRIVSAESNAIRYKLYIALPHSYATSSTRYPVVYLLDADYSFPVARSVGDHLSERNDLREVIYVGIAYEGPPQYHLNRTRDYTPVFAATGGYDDETQKVSGGGPKFRQALENDLFPFIDRTYRTIAGDRTLVGHSFGGLFASWDLLSPSPLFQRYIIVSPSLWYKDYWIRAFEKQRAAGAKNLRASVYLAVGALEHNSGHDMPADLSAFVKRLRSRRYSGLTVTSACLDGETHNSVFPRALSNGLRAVFSGR